MSEQRSSFKHLVIAAACILVTAGCGLWIYFTQFAAPKFNVPLHRAVGQVMAEETSRLLGHRGNIVVISIEAAPELKVQIEEFEATLKRIGKAKVEKTYHIETEGKTKYGVGSGLSGRRYVRIVNKNLDTDAFVSFVGAPTLSSEELQQLQKRPKFIAESRSAEKLQAHGKQSADLAVVSRFTFPAPVEGKPRTSRQWFDKYFEIITPQKLASRPRFQANKGHQALSLLRLS
jgi:hypothetical protein